MVLIIEKLSNIFNKNIRVYKIKSEVANATHATDSTDARIS